MKSGFYIVGTFLGYFKSIFGDRERHLLGVQIKTPNKYGTFETSTIDVRLSEDLVTSGFKSSLDQFKGKDVILAVNPRQWAMDNGSSGITYYFDGNSSIEFVK
ncbi:DNA-binding protein [Gallibacterium anatis]|uniref:Single-stranded DNA-binding protein n=1 Tax=Gallibacterium anatis 4895 TaxID=1396510 RepID=A0A0A3AE70_9PAST|nr:DNA-binding protein [Gallibacterium anatis]KGQ59894.1 hypothetical protein IO48_10005 [Gallibacterium anatis 4895]